LALTLRAAPAFGAIAYWLQELLGAGVFGPLVISAAALFWFGRVLLNHPSQIAQTARA
jgi:hypothetical protein